MEQHPAVARPDAPGPITPGPIAPGPIAPGPAALRGSPAPVQLRSAQKASYDALALALKEGNVFAALTGPEGCGKTTVMEAVLADHSDRSFRRIRISDAARVTPSLAAQIEQVAAAQSGKAENQDRHIVFAIDDAHTASDDLLRCLTRMALLREPGRRVPQVFLTGDPELWTKLANPEFEPLLRRIAIRAVLPETEGADDPWAAVELDLSKMAVPPPQQEPPPLGRPNPQEDAKPNLDQLYARAATSLPWSQQGVPSADALPRAAERPLARPRRIWPWLLSLGCLAVAAGIGIVAYQRWPAVSINLPWVDSRPDGTAVTASRPVLNVPSVSIPAPVTPTRPPEAVPNPTMQNAVPVVTPERTPIESPGTEVASPGPAPPIDGPAVPPVGGGPAAPFASPGPIVAPEPARVAPPAPALAPAPAPVPVLSSAPVAAPVPPPAATPVVAVPISPSMVALLLRRGDEQAAIGDVSAARLLYERAAEAGSAVAALHLGQTYDAAFLPAASRGTLSEPAAAREWYGRAAALGNRDAAERLQRLNEGH